MLSLYSFFRRLKRLALLVLIWTIAILLHYDSTNPKYLQLRLVHSILSLKYSLIPDQTWPTLSAEYVAFQNIIRMKPSLDTDKSEDPLTIIKKLRSASSMSTVIPKPSQCEIHKEVFHHDGHTVDTYWIDYSIKNSQRYPDKLLIYLHGGGYVLGDIHGYSGIECHLSKLFNITILHLEYRLSPEHSLRAAVDDAFSLYQALLNHNISPSRLLFMGDSAGGGLSLLTIQALIAHKLPIPRGVIVLSPWTDLSASGESYTRNDEIDLLLSIDDAKWTASQLLGPDHSHLTLNNSLFSPLFGSFEGFPSMYINVGTAEILEDDSRVILKRAQEAGVDVTFEEGLHMMHVYPMFFSYFPEARNTLDNINNWIQNIFDQKYNEKI